MAATYSAKVGILIAGVSGYLVLRAAPSGDAEAPDGEEVVSLDTPLGGMGHRPVAPVPG